VGASILEAAGVDLVHVDDDFPNAAKTGLPITTTTTRGTQPDSPRIR